VSWTAGVVLFLYVADRLLLAAEDRGWIYWRKKKASPGTAGNALLHMQAILEPQRRHVLEQRLDEHEEKDDEGDPPR
jgi:hypothetical protein